ncbi:response regulator [Polyangium spumosum]|uniref:Response regulator n=1 Tax=Polyangium spumosum TaxID=889282 RepID=A0A6N7PRM7_9BACT|nr:response regulator [Polyangium spumosum]MRG94579.1 response regulator [Polyangium spumosum]
MMNSMPPIPASRRRPLDRGGAPALTVLCIAQDAAVRELLPRVLRFDKVLVTADFSEAFMMATSEAPDIAFVELGIGDGAGLSLVHHLKALVPDISVVTLATKKNLDAAANALSLGASGLLLMPLSGDDVLSSVWGIKQRLVERAERDRLERAAAVSARATGWIARIAEVAEAPDRTSAAKELVEILVEVTGAKGGAVYLAGDTPQELVLGAASPSLEGAPSAGTEQRILETFATPRRLLAVPLGSRNVAAGYVLLEEEKPRTGEGGPSADPPIDGIIRLLTNVAATAIAMLGERERAARGGAAIKDPTSSAYSFAYYVDVAGREIGRARRYGRRFSIVTMVYEPVPGQASLSATEFADRMLATVHDTDVLARVDENEFHLLLPETSGLGAHSVRRRIARLGTGEKSAASRALLVGAAAFPHDGQDLGKLLRVARARAEASKSSVVHRLDPDSNTVPDLLEMLIWETVNAAPARQTSAVRPIELDTAEAQALAQAVVADAQRGGAATIVVAHHAGLCLGAAVRSALGHEVDNVALHALDLRAVPGCERIEALAVIAEHGAYALLARHDDGILRGAHAADPLLADVLAERLGRAAGVRVIG